MHMLPLQNIFHCGSYTPLHTRLPGFEAFRQVILLQFCNSLAFSMRLMWQNRFHFTNNFILLKQAWSLQVKNTLWKKWILCCASMWRRFVWHLSRMRINGKWCVFTFVDQQSSSGTAEHSCYLIATPYFLSGAFWRMSKRKFWILLQNTLMVVFFPFPSNSPKAIMLSYRLTLRDHSSWLSVVK